jgi:cardiolipin synthase
MSDHQIAAIFWTLLVFLVHLAFVTRAILRPHREPASRVAWIVVLILAPGVGIVAYLLLGETSVGRSLANRMRRALQQLPDPAASAGEAAWSAIPDRYVPLFRVGESINGFVPTTGNAARLLPDSNRAIASLVADIDAAKEHVHVCFYIWLTDHNGIRVAEALARAAARGVVCRAMADALGSRSMIRSEHWTTMRDAGVRVAEALPIGNLLLRPFRGRIDLRNHRKTAVIDNVVAYCGSQNCADPEFRIKAKFAPWVDVMVRFEGPIARQSQHLFAADWMSQTGDDLSALLQQPVEPGTGPLVAQTIGTGPTVRNSAMPETFETLMYAARHELTITTPYYVPDEAMQAALCASARRGVRTTIIFPARNDSWIVSAASRSYYGELLEAGVRVFEYEPGLLHAKTLTLDGEITLIGSANMDRRSFELNYENNVLIYDRDLTSEVRQRQDEYLASSHPITSEMVARWSAWRRLWNNTIAMLGPVL